MESLTLSTCLSPHYPSFNLRHTSFPTPSRKTPLLSLKSSLTSSHQQHPTSKTLKISENDEKLSLLLASSPQTPATAMRGAEADAMGLLFRERIVFLGNSIDDFIADAIISQLLLLDAMDSTKDIRLFINSPGGSLRRIEYRNEMNPNDIYSQSELVQASFSPYPSCQTPLSLKSSLTSSHQQPTSKTLSDSLILDLNFEMGEDEKLSLLLASAPQTPAMAMRGAEADAMGLLFRERIVFLGNNIDDFIADAIISQLLLLDAMDSTKYIRLFNNSPGGSLSATMAIFDVVQLVRADVSTVALGISASTASIILGGGTKGKRYAMPNTRVMIHQPLGGASGQAIDVEIQAREIMHNKDNVTKIISNCTGRSYEQVQKDIDRDRYMSPIEAVEYGLIDGVIDRDSIIPLMPVPERVRSTLNYQEMIQDPKKFLNPEIPDDEIY
ncbi:hypothetical protein RND71_016111 [Anisodus tanguticus]|uniref:ATP-dependent Clp protease proteolytic subunit n=1 Tax=Anisodus tanguticus TaxID=243964 RepID=A0AAE1S6S9_9SOLA|nr:hypothetical protein RND71_016111 [Anisodus tanguticus]